MSKAPSHPNSKKNQQINVKFDDDFRERFLAACEFQEHSAGQLARILIEWALPFYERAQSVKSLKALTRVRAQSVKDLAGRQAEIARKVFEGKKPGRPAKDRKQSGT